MVKHYCRPSTPLHGKVEPKLLTLALNPVWKPVQICAGITFDISCELILINQYLCLLATSSPLNVKHWVSRPPSTWLWLEMLLKNVKNKYCIWVLLLSQKRICSETLNQSLDPHFQNPEERFPERPSGVTSHPSGWTTSLVSHSMDTVREHPGPQKRCEKIDPLSRPKVFSIPW